MKERFDLSSVVFVAASASGLLATLTACGVEPRRAIESAHQLSDEARIWDRTLGVLGIWGGLVQTWLDRLLPEDAAQRCSGRVALLLSQMSLRGFRHVYVDQCALLAALLPRTPVLLHCCCCVAFLCTREAGEEAWYCLG